MMKKIKLITTPCGTASYAPPEMHRGEEYYGLLSDVWSAGVLLYAMVFGYLPFCEEDEEVNIDNIIKGNYEIPEEASPDLEDLIKHIMDIDPLTRYDLDQIKKHPWYNLVTPPKCYPGLVIGYHKIPIDERILKVCEAYGFNKDEVEKSVRENKYDNKSSIYYIILSKMKREGYESISDLYSQEYLNYINDKKNIIEKKEEDDKDKDKDKESEDKKQKGLELLNDVLKIENDEKDKINNLEQIESNNIKDKNEKKDEVSVASENSKSKSVSRKSSNNSLNKENDNKKAEIILETLDNKINKDNIKVENKDEKESNEKNEIIIEQNKEEPKEINTEIKPTEEQIANEEKEKIEIIKVEIPETEIKNQEEKKGNVIQISEPEKKDEKETLVVLTDKIEPEKEVTSIKENKIEEKKEINPKEKEKESKKNKLLIPKHSFYINMDTKKLLLHEFQEGEYNTENMNPNKLNSSFTQKLTDSLKENVFKMRNPKAKIPNKDKEINNALKEIKQNKKGKINKKKKENIKKNNKVKKLHKEPLFRGNKRNDHTIIHNRNASAINAERKKNNIDDNEKNNNNKIKNNKNASSSVEKTNKNHIHNKNIDLNNNIKKVKIPNTKEKEKDKNKRENSIEKRKTKKYDKFINKNIKHSMTVKKGEKNDNNITSSGTALMTVSNSKHNRIKSSLNTSTSKKTDLKTPSKHNRIKSSLNTSTSKKTDLKTPSKNKNKAYIEPFYKRLNSTNVTKNENHNLSHVGNLNKALELSEVKESNPINKLSNIKASNQNYQKNIRLTYKNIYQEEFVQNDIQPKKTFGHTKIRSGINLSFNINDKNIHKQNSMNKSAEKRKINHLKSHSIEVNSNSKANKVISSYQNTQKNQPYKEFLYKNSFQYPSIVKTDKNVNKMKKFINLSSFNGPLKTEINNDKKGNQKFWKKKQEEDIIKECYYKGPIDLKNIFIGNSIDEIQEILIGILIKNRIKFWKMNSFRFYCKKNGESFVIRIYILSDKIKTKNSEENISKNKEEIKVSEFDINKKSENEENKINGDNGNKIDRGMIFYICVLSKESNNKTQARQLNKIINKKLSEIFKK